MPSSVNPQQARQLSVPVCCFGSVDSDAQVRTCDFIIDFYGFIFGQCCSGNHKAFADFKR